MIFLQTTLVVITFTCFARNVICKPPAVGVFEPISPTDEDLFQKLKHFFDQQNVEVRQELLRLRSELQQMNLQQRASQQTLDTVQQQMQHVQTEIHELSEKSSLKDQLMETFRSGRSLDVQVEPVLSSKPQQTILQRLSNELLDSLPTWQQRIESKLNKIMNVAAEIYKEDKQLSQTLTKLNELQSLDGQADPPQSIVHVRKTLQEELSVVRAELRNQFSIVERQCASDREQHENVTFLVLGLKDDLLTQTSKLCKNKRPDHELSILDNDNEDDSTGNQQQQPMYLRWELLLNTSVGSLRDEMQRMHSQLVSNLQREHREVGDRLITLSNNYQHLNQLRNCDNHGRAVKSNEIPLQPVLSESVAPVYQPATTNKLDTSAIVSKENLSHVASNPNQQPNGMLWTTNNPVTSRSAQNQQLARESQSNSIPNAAIHQKAIRPVRHGQNVGPNCKMDTNLMAPGSCSELFKDAGATCDGAYIIMLNYKALRVYCEMHDGGWTVIMRRGKFHDHKRHMNFNQEWSAYRNGFGDPNDEFWIGNEHMHQLTMAGDQLLQIDLESFDGERISIQYNRFKVNDERSGYRLEIGEPNNDLPIANHLLKQNRAMFATRDHNADPYNCPQRYEAGWWFSGQQCHTVLLTGTYNEQDKPLFKEGIQWPAWKNNQFLKAVQMKVRPK